VETFPELVAVPIEPFRPGGSSQEFAVKYLTWMSWIVVLACGVLFVAGMVMGALSK